MTQFVVNEQTQRFALVQGLPPLVIPDFFDMWYRDLDNDCTSLDQLVNNANAILTYYNSPLRAQSVTMDTKSKCFVWLMSRKD